MKTNCAREDEELWSCEGCLAHAYVDVVCTCDQLRTALTRELWCGPWLKRWSSRLPSITHDTRQHARYAPAQTRTNGLCAWVRFECSHRLSRGSDGDVRVRLPDLLAATVLRENPKHLKRFHAPLFNSSPPLPLNFLQICA